MPDPLLKTPTTCTESDVAPSSKEEVRLRENPRAFSLWERVQICLASWVGYLAVLLIGHSLRWEVYGWENWEAASKRGQGLIYTFWHREIFSACWFWRKRGIVVMTSRNFDGEYIARIIQGHGYGAARGSSTRGASRALAEMIAYLRNGRDGAFTIDGPRGPRYVAKRGSVLLSKTTGAAILCFHVALRRAYVFRRTWDLTQFPHPFSRAAIFIAPPIVVSPQASEEEQASKLREVQNTLDDLRRQGEEWALRSSKLENRK
ncbi:MAG: lysophospholipid acyltransferase family protein [Terriglobia bacterium]|jgi:hypothetical protein